MRRSRRQWLAGASAAAGSMMLASPARSQAWPSKPIRVVVPYPVGGAVDVMTRLITAHMQNTLGCPG